MRPPIKAAFDTGRIHDQLCRCGNPCKAGPINPRRRFFRHTRLAIAIACIIMTLATLISYN